MSKLYLIIIFFTLSMLHLQAQTFKAGIIAGFTASQINGDNDAGFNKPGFEAGLKSLVSISEKADLSLEILYSQRGSKESVVPGQVQNIYRIDYVAIPVIYSYKDWLAEDYSRLHFHGGLSYGRLINAELDNDDDNTDFVNAWRENDLSILVGATYFVNKHFGLTFRYNRSLFLLFESDSSVPNGGDSLLAFNLSFHALYMF